MDKKIFNKNLQYVIYTIGYHKEGESVLVFIKTDDVIVFTVVIDSYEEGEINITCELLARENLNHIDMVCWSHPDKDHSLGISKYLKWIDERTIILVGDGFVETQENWKDADGIMYDYIDSELKKNLNIKKRTIIRKVVTGMCLKKLTFIDARTGFEYPFEISTFAPSDYQILRRSMQGMSFPKNLLSVGMVIKLGTVVGIFSGDVLDVVFNTLTAEDFPEYIDYLKIPHHCSKSSKKILGLFLNKAEVACTTVNVTNSLPDMCLLNQYKGKVNNIYCTNDVIQTEQKDFWGMIKTTFNIDKQNEVISECFGNAVEVF